VSIAISPERLREARVRAGLSQGDLASLVGVSQTAISTWESGTARPREGARRRLLAALALRDDTSTVSTEELHDVSRPRVVPEQLRDARIRAGLSQGDLALRIGVSQATVSTWENGTSQPRTNSADALATVLDLGVETEDAAESPGSSPYGEWLARTRNQQGITRRELADRANVSEPQIWNIETGHTLNPRAETRDRLAKALGSEPSPETVSVTQQDAEIPDVGILTDFDPHNDDDLPPEPGIYVFYDISERPVYVGQSDDIRRRIAGHADKFWYKRPIVETAAYVRIADKKLRSQVETTMIRFLKSNGCRSIGGSHAGAG
jgi:transcriptional regulator with XRE-family HTH domain